LQFWTYFGHFVPLCRASDFRCANLNPYTPTLEKSLYCHPVSFCNDSIRKGPKNLFWGSSSGNDFEVTDQSFSLWLSTWNEQRPFTRENAHFCPLNFGVKIQIFLGLKIERKFTKNSNYSLKKTWLDLLT